MDLNLFGAVQEPITAERFAAWPEHMRREFALLVAEKSRGSDGVVRDLTGISIDALDGARAAGRLYALTWPTGESLDEDDAARRERRSESAKRYQERKREAAKRHYYKKRRDADA